MIASRGPARASVSGTLPPPQSFDDIGATTRFTMNTTSLMMIAIAGAALCGCNKAESPADVRQDVAEATAEGNKDVADARADAQKDVIDAQTDVTKAVAEHQVADAINEAQEADEVAAKGDAKIQLAQAEAAHRVEIEKCEALTGDARKHCKDSADANLDAAKEHAEMRREAAR
jgi:hypothetical protein